MSSTDDHPPREGDISTRLRQFGYSTRAGSSNNNPRHWTEYTREDHPFSGFINGREIPHASICKVALLIMSCKIIILLILWVASVSLLLTRV